MRDKQGALTRPNAALSDPAIMMSAVSVEERQDFRARVELKQPEEKPEPSKPLQR